MADLPAKASFLKAVTNIQLSWRRYYRLCLIERAYLLAVSYTEHEANKSLIWPIDGLSGMMGNS